MRLIRLRLPTRHVYRSGVGHKNSLIALSESYERARRFLPRYSDLRAEKDGAVGPAAGRKHNFKNRVVAGRSRTGVARDKGRVARSNASIPEAAQPGVGWIDAKPRGFLRARF